MPSTHSFSHKIIATALALGIIGSSVAFAAQSDVINAVSQIRQTDPNVPLSSNQKGNVGTILDNIFGTGVKQGKILSDYLDLAGTANYMPKYAGTGNGFVNSQVFDNGTNVGIGTSGPTAKLDVNGDIRVASGNRLWWDANTDQGFIRFNSTGDSAGQSSLEIGTTDNSDEPILFTQTGNERMRIHTNGNVGIGTSSPNARLHLYKNTTSDSDATLSIDGPTNSERSIIFRDNWSDAWWFWRDNNGDINTGLGFWRSWVGFALSLRDNWNIGIGTTAPSQKLEVNWEIRSIGSINGFASVDRSDGVNRMIMYLNNGALNFDDYWAGTRLSIQRVSWNVWIWNTSPGYKLHVSGDIYANGGWLRTSGNAGWYSESYGGGWFMQDTTWIRGYNGKSLWMGSGLLGGDGGLTVGYGGATPPSGGAIIAGNVGIGNSSPTTRLQIGDGGDGYANGLTIRSNYPTIYFRDTDNRSAMIHVNSNTFHLLRGCGNDGVGGGNNWCTTSNGYWPLTINLENNDATFGGGVYAFNYFYNSDRRLKENIVPLDDALGKIRKLNGYTYDWKSSKKSDIGVIAQEVEQVYPQLVGESKDGSGTTIKTVEYGNLVAPLIEATKTIANTNDAQDKEIAELKAQIAELKQVVKHLESSKK